jgi:hypothetical protein
MKLTSRFVPFLFAIWLLVATQPFTQAQGELPTVRVVHTAPGAPPFDVLANGRLTFPQLKYGTASDYRPFNAGNYNMLRVLTAGLTSTAILTTGLDLSLNTHYSVVMLGRAANLSALTLVDDPVMPPLGQAKLRFIHAAPDAPAVDVALRNGRVLFSNVAFKWIGAYQTVAAGMYDLEIRVAGTSQIITVIPQVPLNSATVYTMLAIGLLSGPQPGLNALLLNDVASGLTPPPCCQPAEPAPHTYYHNYTPADLNQYAPPIYYQPQEIHPLNYYEVAPNAAYPPPCPTRRCW